jgi:hypothetical protein
MVPAMRKHTLIQLSMLLVLGLTGCSTGPTIFEREDPYSVHKPGSDAWWAEKALLPPGVRQKCKKGKMWPVRPRSTQEPQQFSHTYHSQHYWPLPYVCQDRQYVHGVLAQQATAGWTEETTLYEHHFDPEVNELTRAGELHLNWILNGAPAERRTVYMQSTFDDAVDAVRMASVQTYIATRSRHPDVPVIVRNALETNRSAREVGRINELYNNSIPAPRLGSGGGGGGGAAAGGGGGGGDAGAAGQ